MSADTLFAALGGAEGVLRLAHAWHGCGRYRCRVRGLRIGGSL
jgi:hypothetical protein